MHEDDQTRRSDWYSTDSGEFPRGFHSPQPADAAPHSTHLPPRRAAGSSADYSEPYWSSEKHERRKKHKGATRVAAVCVLLVILIAASALLFSRDDDPSASLTPPVVTGPGVPDAFDDYRDFFENYYESESTITGENNIPRAKTGTGVRMALSPLPEAGELTYQEIYEKCAPAVVAITAETSSVSYSWGTGIVLSTDGYILTNTHVLDGAFSAAVTLWDDRQFEAKLVGADSISDIAVLKIEVTGLTAAEFGETAVRVGDRVVAIGNPLGQELRGTMTDGIISAISRDISYNRHSMTLLQTNAAINEGNSGGPLINMYGQVVGITNMKMMSSSGYSSIEGIGFAIPIETMKTVTDALIASGKVMGRPAIGITVGPIPESAAGYYDLPEGLYISDVTPGSDAEAKGIVAGDILTAVNGTPVSTTQQVAILKENLAVGDTLLLTIFRNGQSFDVEVALVESSDIY